MSRLRDWLANGPLITDGAWGTELQKRGLAPGLPSDPWNIERPDEVERLACDYVAAGSQVILTNTLTSLDTAVIRAGVSISKRAAGDSVLVFGSIGPVGGPDELERKAEVLGEAGVDALLLETMTDVDFARMALRAARRTGLPVIVSFALHAVEGARLMEGEGADGVGINCQPEGVCADACRRIAEGSSLPIWLKPSGPCDGDLIAEAGASFVGGCCGTDPEYIRALHCRMWSSKPQTFC